jgi:dihydrofolate reductase
MSKVFVNLGISLDGYIAGPNRGPANPLGDRGRSIHEWLFEQRAFREHLHLGDGGKTGEDNRVVERVFARIGANVMGKRMFEEGERAWPERAPFGCPVFVLTHTPREPWPRPGGTTFYFVTDGIESALAKAREAAGARDVRISGGAETVLEYLNAGLVDELELALAPVFLGEGLRLFDGIDRTRVALELEAATRYTTVAHLRYRVRGQ